MFFNLFKKKETKTVIEENNLDLLKQFNYDSITDNTITGGNTNSDKTLLIMDDITLSKTLIESDFNEINNKYGLNVYDKFKIIWVVGPNCGITTYKKIMIDNIEVSHVLFDITIGELVKVEDQHILLSGVNILTEILKYKNLSFRLITAHTMNNENNYISSISNHFNNELNMDINNFIIKKNSTDRIGLIYDFLK